MLGVQTMQGLLAYCAAYPFFDGETQKNSRRAKEDVVRIKGREISPDLKIDPIDNPTLARILVSYQKQLEIKEGELVEQIGVRKNKNRTYVECRFISPEQKARERESVLFNGTQFSNLYTVKCWHQMKCPELQQVNTACAIFLISCMICLAH